MKKWVLITGGSRGIGAAIVHKLAEDYKVIFTYKNSTDKAKKIVDNMISNGLDVSSYQCDSSNSKEINLLCDQLISKYGAPFALINNSGISQDELFINSSEDSIYKLFNNNAFSTMNIIRYFLPHMMQNLEGRIINISSIASFKGNIGQVGYSSTKSALNGMIKSLALETARFNITVNNILPGFIESDMTENLASKSLFKKKIPLRRFGKPEEIASVTKFLLSPDSGYLTGQNLIIDGGLSC
ncbi:SDR family NAD(P)-dependent oxidoreductase [Acinetobacter pittii]|uniref:SDR family NAD(P)-dependent oxidoreductase n=1 Tax=Acinetobacter pittii TaxID=48296 RepID=UPI0024DED050|nr:SDR family NAD(P)-dependent oxidoreductase [Acinetobacter pittii]